MKGRVSLFIHIQIVDKISCVLFSGLENQLGEKFEQSSVKIVK
jgi:hypothetical protein